MHQRSIVRIGVPLAVAALALSACGSRGDSGTSSGGSTGGAATKTAKIGVIAPLSGDLSALGKGIQHSVELAVKQANDPSADPGLEARGLRGRRRRQGRRRQERRDQARRRQRRHRRRRQPELQRQPADPADLPGGADHPGLAREHRPVADPGRRLRSTPRSGRTTRTSAPAPPTWSRARSRRSSSRTRGINKVATINDKKTYGQGLVNAFTANFTKLGGTVVAAETINPDESNFRPVVSKVAPSKPQAGLLRRRVPAGRPALAADEGRRPQRPAHGRRRHLRPEVHRAGRCRRATVTSPPPSARRRRATDTGKKFVADYKAAGYAEPSAAYGGYSYDAANAIIALPSSPGRQGDRRQVGP